MSETAILWVRRDLRIDDNPALRAAMSRFERVLPLYVHAPEEEAPWEPGAASRWWLHHGLAAFDERLRGLGSRLAIALGPSQERLLATARAIGATAVLWNRLYEPALRERDTGIKLALRESGISCESFNGTLLREPWEIRTGNGEPYRVYSPFWRKNEAELTKIHALPPPERLVPAPACEGVGLARLALLPRIRWDTGLAAHWQPGEAGAWVRARRFIRDHLDDYGERRDIPAEPGTSGLSPHLHFGEIGPRRLLEMIRELPGEPGAGGETFLRELVWREFAHHLLFHFPHTTDAPLDARFEALPWREDPDGRLLDAWHRGRTGIPLVDAGLRELWHQGWMHNRVRMVVASFLTKNLRLPWQVGARWFWDTLVDADLASNTLGWQWSAGCGADAAPYFRVFNPVRQGERFDPRGAYVRRWCPELSQLPDRYIHQPWAAPPRVLDDAGVRLGRDYPHPVADLSASRKEALAAYERVKASPRP